MEQCRLSHDLMRDVVIPYCVDALGTCADDTEFIIELGNLRRVCRAFKSHPAVNEEWYEVYSLKIAMFMIDPDAPSFNYAFSNPSDRGVTFSVGFKRRVEYNLFTRRDLRHGAVEFSFAWQYGPLNNYAEPPQDCWDFDWSTKRAMKLIPASSYMTTNYVLRLVLLPDGWCPQLEDGWCAKSWAEVFMSRRVFCESFPLRRILAAAEGFGRPPSNILMMGQPIYTAVGLLASADNRIKRGAFFSWPKESLMDFDCEDQSSDDDDDDSQGAYKRAKHREFNTLVL